MKEARTPRKAMVKTQLMGVLGNQFHETIGD
jgi:hypothetical protein